RARKLRLSNRPPPQFEEVREFRLHRCVSVLLPRQCPRRLSHESLFWRSRLVSNTGARPGLYHSADAFRRLLPYLRFDLPLRQPSLPVLSNCLGSTSIAQTTTSAASV